MNTDLRSPPQHKSQPLARGVFPAKRVLDLKSLKEMGTTEVVYKLNESMARFKLFLQSQEEQHNSDDFIFDLTCTLAIVCDAPPEENTNKILAALKGSLFLSSKIPRLLDRVQGSSTLNKQESQPRLIQWLIKVFKRYLRHLPSSYADLPYDQLKRTLDQSNIDRKHDLQKELEAFKQTRDDIIIAERQKHGRRYINRTGQRPPDDFRDIPICPTKKEITSQERPFLRKNISKGRYEDAEHYLDVQFRLLREDFLEPLREGIYETTHNIPRAQRNQLMKCYQGVRIIGKQFTLSGIIHNAKFDVSKFARTKWTNSKKLIFGSLLCLSKDNFETMLFATVANRDPMTLAKGRFDIRFIEEQNIFDIEKRHEQYQMVESPAYFEAYRHVLKGLKGLDESTLPFKKYLVECSAEVDPPEYLRRDDDQDPVCYDLSEALDIPFATKATRVPVLEPKAWPSVDILPLNSSQLEALRTAVTTEFSVIQGPPGTGKTYVGAKIVRCLLDNREQWDPEHISPMLMVCYTNHALDQFLEKVLEFLPARRIIRVGGRCKSEQLEDCNLKVFTKKYRRHRYRNSIREKIEGNEREMEGCKKVMAKADEVLLEFQDLEDGMNSRHTDQLYEAVFPSNATRDCQNTPNTFTLWLCNNSQLNDMNQRSMAPTKSEKIEGQDGSILQEDGTVEDVKVHSGSFVEGFDVNTNTNHVQDNIVRPDQQSVQYSPKENPTNGIATGDKDQRCIFESGKSLSPKTQLKANTVFLNGSSKSNSINVGWEHTVHDDSSNNQTAEQRNIPKALQQSLQDYSHFPVSRKLKEGTATGASQLSDFHKESDPVSKLSGTDKDKSKEEIIKPNEADEETITVEDEATRMQNQRYIEGDEDYMLVKQSDKGKRQEENDERVIEETEGWTKVTYKRNAPNFVWKKKESRITKQETKGQLVEAEDSQRQDTATKKSKKKGKKTNSKSDLTANISNIREQLQKETMMSDDETMRVANIWFLSAKDRLRLYLYWVECYRERHRMEVHRGEQKHEELCAELEWVRAEEEEEVIRCATVVGMTTSGAARYHSMLQRIAPQIVIIEEAAEVMEAHIITSLSRDTKHTILIGDHKQLRPKATVYELAQKYNLEISLFERMVMNSMDCKRLCIQHRMRPEIAALTKRIYDHDIIDHETVCEFEDMSGVTHNMFFVDHCQPEILVGGLQSYSNPHEATFLIALCYYLLLQGYKPSQITILTMYIGQVLLLQEQMPRRTFGGVKVCAVDNFQGEENDIILLTLVRSNSERRIGFLSESNRICVALSRARQGFYCIGNFKLLKSQCKLWQEICDDLETKNSIGEALSLVCKKHNNVTNVRTSSDFDMFGGCKLICGDRLDCGHACDRPCHASDLYHQKSQCSKLCFKCCPNEHQCQKTCHYPRRCRDCREVMWKTVPQCEHEQLIPCSVDPATFSCTLKCEKILQCEHHCGNTCGELCTTQCKVKCIKLLPCKHEKSMPCFRDPMLETKCNSNCDKVLECDHPCTKRCREKCQCNTEVVIQLPCEHWRKVLCDEKDYPCQCFERCRRTLDCGHDCPGICNEDCRMKECKVEVYKDLPCGHQQSVPCFLDPQKAFCRAPCQRQLDCGHKCSSVCGRVCQEVQCEELCPAKCERGHACQKRCHFGLSCGYCMVAVNMTIPTCKHSIEMPCYIDSTTLRCNKACEKLRVCGHPCRGICSKNCEARPCKEPVTTTLLCAHAVTLTCHKDPKKYRCKEIVEVYLSCGHNKPLVCHAAKTDVQNVLCNVKVEKELPCKHKLTLPCHKNPEECKCKKKVDVQLSCGHIKSLSCSTMTTDLQNVSCMVKMKRKLPCQHDATLPCYKNPEEHCCQEEVHVTLSCGHKLLTTCSRMRDELKSERCDTKVTRKLPCGHEKGMQCSDKPGEVFCDVPCDRVLPCEHPCPQKCGDDCASFKCAVGVQKDLACGFHKVSCLCCDDVSQIVCANKCKQKLPCGHVCPGTCTENCSKYKCQKPVVKRLDCAGKHSLKMACSDDPTIITCQKQCNRDLDCGHPCPGRCSEQCERMRCMRGVEKTFPCGHKESLKCFQSKAATCTAPCRRRKRSCKHICKGICGQNCSNYPCDVAVGKILLCGHNIKMRCSHSADDVQCPAACKAKLPCGHYCSGTCNDCQQRGSHEFCQHSCGRLLVCSHRCKATCSEPCPPCDRKCGRRCPHGKCKKRCSQLCQVCTEPCTWSCPHYQCNNLCGEECDRPRCDAPCPLKLSCRHPCIGLCGENCPSVCAVCHAKKLSSMLVDGRGNKATRCLQLFDCGHIIKVEEMDAWMLRELGDDVQLMQCPKCSTSITFNFRYGNIIKRTLTNIENVKTHIQGLENEVTNSVRLIGKDVKRKRPWTILQTDLSLHVVQSIPWTWNPFDLRHMHKRNVLLMFTLKNHLMILQQVQRTEQVLQNGRRFQAIPEVDELWNATKDALEKIKEYLEEPQLDLKTLSQVHEQTRKFFQFSHVLEAQSKGRMDQTPFSSIAKTRLKLARDRFAVFLQGNDDALDLEWLGKIVNLLRTEMNLPLLPPEEAKDFANFPGYQRGVWKLCEQSHVYFTGWIVRGGEDIQVGSQGCSRCTAQASN